jgi:tRNA(Ile)-lysidine synthase
LIDRLRAMLGQDPRPARLWIAYSGGCDSHVLLHACVALRATLELTLSAIHVDHGLHPKAGRWADHCRGVCDQLGVDYHERKVQIDRTPGESLEALARTARQRVFADCLGPDDWLATAQHRDDQAETLLLALLRGSGVHGLAAMPTRAPLGAGRLIRPLLGCAQADLRAYAEQHRLRWIEDPSNEDLGFDRNLLRHRIMPILRQRWPSAATTIARSAAHCAEAAALIDAMADEQLPTVAGSRPGTLSVARLSVLAHERARVLLRRWLAQHEMRPPAATRLETILSDVFSARVDASPLVVWEGCELRRYRDDLFALAPLPPRPEGELRWDGRQPLRLPQGLGRLSLEIADAGQAVSSQWQPMTIHFGSPGVFGSPGLRCRRLNRPSRSLKHLLQQAGIPSWLRPYVPLLLDAQGELLAVAGIAGCGSTHPQQRLRWEGHPWTSFDWLSEPVEINLSPRREA